MLVIPNGCNIYKLGCILYHEWLYSSCRRFHTYLLYSQLLKLYDVIMWLYSSYISTLPYAVYLLYNRFNTWKWASQLHLTSNNLFAQFPAAWFPILFYRVKNVRVGIYIFLGLLTTNDKPGNWSHNWKAWLWLVEASDVWTYWSTFFIWTNNQLLDVIWLIFSMYYLLFSNVCKELYMHIWKSNCQHNSREYKIRG